MQEQILKVVDVNSGKTNFIFFPERVVALTDTSKGCRIDYSDSGHYIVVAGVSALKMKRSIQEQLQEDHSIAFLKLESNYFGHKGKEYINIYHIAGIIDYDETCSIVFEHLGHQTKIQEPAYDVAFQIRRLIKKLDQDQDLCCETVAAEESDTE